MSGMKTRSAGSTSLCKLGQAVALGVAGIVAACAPVQGPPPPQSAYSEELAALEADCAARGGIMEPTGQMTNRASTDHRCRVLRSRSRP